MQKSNFSSKKTSKKKKDLSSSDEEKISTGVSLTPPDYGMSFVDNQQNNLENPKEEDVSSSELLDDFVTAYNKARLYHGSPVKEDVAKTGLLTSKGGTKTHSEPNTGGRVFLGWSEGT